MIRAFLALGILALLLTGCGGDFASPTTTTTTTYTTTTTAAAELSQAGNRATCTGLVVIGSCNTTATQTQTTSRPAAPARTPDAGLPTWGDVCMWLLITAMCCALFCLLIGGIKWIFGGSDTEAN
jgi:hypothetical protein